MCVRVCVPKVYVCVYLCAPECHIATLCADTAPGATGCTWCVRAVHQLLMLECQMRTHRHTHWFVRHTQVYICSLCSLYMCACIQMALYWHIDLCSFMSRMVYHVWMHISIFTEAAKNGTHRRELLNNEVPPGTHCVCTQWQAILHTSIIAKASFIAKAVGFIIFPIELTSQVDKKWKKGDYVRTCIGHRYVCAWDEWFNRITSTCLSQRSIDILFQPLDTWHRFLCFTQAFTIYKKL